jgi:hypothetical protein
MGDATHRIFGRSLARFPTLLAPVGDPLWLMVALVILHVVVACYSCLCRLWLELNAAFPTTALQRRRPGWVEQELTTTWGGFHCGRLEFGGIVWKTEFLSAL